MTSPVCVASTGSNTSPYETWAKAATSFQTGLTQASTTGDEVRFDTANVPAADKENAADVTYTLAGNCRIICGTQSGASGITPAAMGTATWIGNSTANRSVLLAGAFRAYIFGLTIRTAGATADSIGWGASDDVHYEAEQCYLWNGNSNASAFLRLGHSAANSANCYLKFTTCTFRLGAVAQAIRIAANVEMVDCSLSSAGTAPTTSVFNGSDSSDAGGGRLTAIGCDWSYGGSCPLVGDVARPAQLFEFIQCKLGSGYTMLAAQTATNKSSGQVWVRDCASGDDHGLFGYADAMGSVVSDTGIYYTSGAAGQSWKVVTTAAASFSTPFVTPWISRYYTAQTTTPRLEILRNNSTAAYQDNEVSTERMAKDTSGSTKSSFASDRMAVGGSAANQAAGDGLGSWTGEGGSAWSGKLDAGSVVLAEAGYVAMRFVFGAPIATAYVHPQILS